MAKFQTVNPHWIDEHLYQESRRIVIAQLQHITYNEFLPILIGQENRSKFKLKLQSYGYSKEYDENMDPTVLNTYAAAAGQVNVYFLQLGLTSSR